MVTYRRVTHGWQFLFLGPEEGAFLCAFDRDSQGEHGRL